MKALHVETYSLVCSWHGQMRDKTKLAESIDYKSHLMSLITIVIDKTLNFCCAVKHDTTIIQHTL